MKSRKVLLLYDSVNDNTGDRAIGEVMVDFVLAHGGEPVVVDPLKKGRLTPPVVVGGGEILHPPGDPFYDQFRVPGPHILNAAGVTGRFGMEHLADYAYVSVRSTTDKALVSEVRPDAEVVPCVATLLEPAEPPSPPTRPTVLVHLHHYAAHICKKLPFFLEKTVDYDIRWLSLTPYAGDRATMTKLSAWMDRDVELDPSTTPREKLGAIVRSRLLVCASLHGAIFAHAHGIPFLVFARPPKIRAFLEDRGLERFGFHSDLEFQEKLEAVLEEDVDFSATVEADRRRLEEHMDRLVDILGLSKVRGEVPSQARDKVRSPGRAATVLEKAQLLQAYKELEDSASHIRAFRGIKARLEADLDAHRRELETHRQETERLRGELETHRQETERLRGELEAHVQDRDRWRERAQAAEERLDVVERELAALGSQAQYLEAIRHELVQISNSLRLAQATRTSERLLRFSKRAARKVLSELDRSTRDRVSRALERLVGRPLELEGGSTEGDEPGRPGVGRAGQGVDTGDAAAPSPAGRRAHRSYKGAFPQIRADVSVLIPTLDAGSELADLLEAVRAQRGIGEVEIVVVDSSSSDDTVELAESFGAIVKVIPQQEFGHGTTRNELASLASYPYLLFCTQDAIPAGDDVVRRMLDLLLSEERVAAVSARQIPRTDADLYSAFTSYYHSRMLRLEADMIFPPDGEKAANLEALDFWTLRRWVSVDNVFALYNRGAWEQLKFRAVPFAEDLDFGKRALENGFKLGYCHGAGVIHSHDRPAAYHFRRHVADRLFVAGILEPLYSTPSPEHGLGSAVAATQMLLCSLDSDLSAFGGSGAEELLGTLRAWATRAPGEILSAGARSGAPEGKVKGPSATPSGAGPSQPEAAELYGVLRKLRGGREDPGAEAGDTESVEAEAAAGSLLRRLSDFLDSPLLAEFAAANKACGRDEAVTFGMRLFGGVAGAFLGDVLRAEGAAEEVRTSLLRGI